MNRENSTLEGSQLSIVFGASKYSSEKKDGNSDEKCWTCWDSGFAFNVLSSKQMSLGKSGWVLAIITLPASHWESTSSTVLLKKKRTSELQDPWIHVSNANVEVPSFRHLSLVGVLPWYKPNINAQRRKRFLSFSTNLVSMFRQRNQGANFKCFTTAANWPCSLAAASSSWNVMEELWTKILEIAMTGFTNWHLWQNVAWMAWMIWMIIWSCVCTTVAGLTQSGQSARSTERQSVAVADFMKLWNFPGSSDIGMKSCVHCHIESLVSSQ